MKRRKARAKLEAVGKIPKNRQVYSLNIYLEYQLIDAINCVFNFRNICTNLVINML